MRFIGMLLTSLMLIALSACNTPGCLVQAKVADVAANFTGSVLECSDIDGLRKELNDSVLSHTGLCKSAEAGVPQGVLADTFCPVIASTVVEFVKAQGQGFLDRHGCKANTATAFSKEKLTALCKLLPLSQH